MSARSKSLGVLPRLISMYRRLAYVAILIGVISSLANLTGYGNITARSNQVVALFLEVFSPMLLWGLVALGLYTMGVVLQLLQSIERSARATAATLQRQVRQQPVDEGKNP